MSKDLALIAEGGGMRGAYVYGAMLALEEVFNDQHGLANFKYLAGTSASALTIMYTLSGQFHSDGLEIWSEKVADKRFLDHFNLKRLVTGPSILDTEYLIDEIFEKQHPLAWNKLKQNNSKFYIPLIDVNELNLKFYTNDLEVNPALFPYDVIFMDRDNPAEIYSMMKAAAGAPVFFNKEIEIQGGLYVDAGHLLPFPLTAPIPNSAKRIVILTKPGVRRTRWLHDRLLPSMARSGFLHGGLSNSDVYSMTSQESKNYKALLDQLVELESQQSCFVIKPEIEMSSSDNRLSILERNMEAGKQDVLDKKEELQAFLIS